MGESVLAQHVDLPCGLVLPNRVLKSAMGEQLADPNTGDYTPQMASLYARWADGGAGTLVTGATLIEREARDYRAAVIDDQASLDALIRFAAHVHAQGAVLIAQLVHLGRQAFRYTTRRPVGPSALPAVRGNALAAPCRALTGEEIAQLVQRFAVAATGCEAAGFDGVQLHGAHGYLIGQFLSPLTNLREDEWGGDLEGRSRFLLKIVDAIRGGVGEGFAVSVKINASDFQPGGFDIDDSAHVVGQLGQHGVDLIEISGGTPESEGQLMDGMRGQPGTSPEAYFAGFAPRLREMTEVPLALTGGLRSRQVMERLVGDGVVDLIGLARPLVQRPEFASELIASTADRIDLVAPPAETMTEAGLHLFWYQAQFERLAEGKDYDADLPVSKIRTLMLNRAARVGVRRGRDRMRDLIASP